MIPPDLLGSLQITSGETIPRVRQIVLVALVAVQQSSNIPKLQKSFSKRFTPLFITFFSEQLHITAIRTCYFFYKMHFIYNKSDEILVVCWTLKHVMPTKICDTSWYLPRQMSVCVSSLEPYVYSSNVLSHGSYLVLNQNDHWTHHHNSGVLGASYVVKGCGQQAVKQ